MFDSNYAKVQKQIIEWDKKSCKKLEDRLKKETKNVVLLYILATYNKNLR